jgi:hypothetical protein
MNPVLLVAAIATVPAICLGLLLWLSWLEDTLDRSVERAQRRSVPEPILAIPVQRVTSPVAPAARPDTEPVGHPMAQPVGESVLAAVPGQPTERQPKPAAVLPDPMPASTPAAS